MKKRWIILISLSLLATAGTLSGTTPAATQQPTPVNRVDISASAETIAVGATVSVTGTITGNFGNPMYAIQITDQDHSSPDLWINLTQANEIGDTTGSSAVLALASTAIEGNRFTAVLKALAPGVAKVVMAVNGEIVETDSSGRSFFNYVTKFSEGWTITVSPA